MKKLLLGLVIIPNLQYAMDSTHPNLPLKPLSEQFSWRSFDDSQNIEIGLPLFKQLLVHAWRWEQMLESTALKQLLERVREKKIKVWHDDPFEPKEFGNKVILSKKDAFVRLLSYVAHNGIVLETDPPQYPVEINGKKINLCITYEKMEPSGLSTYTNLELPISLEQKYNEILPH